MTKKRLLAASILMIVVVSVCAAQKPDEAAALKARAQVLMDQLKYTDAVPLYESLVKLLPNDPDVHRNFGTALLGLGANTSEAAARRQLRIRARDMFTIARDLGDKSLFVRGMIDGLPADGGDPNGFSDNAEANKAMQKGESLFASGKPDDAFDAYQEALNLDPNCYYAALFSGDVKMHGGQFDQAEKWYQRAISIDPYRETAYRYSATPLMKQQKYEQARDRYIEAYILAPYDKLATSGFVTWAQITKTLIGHPRFDIPDIALGKDGKTKTNITVTPSDDGSMGWIAYVNTRDDWRKGKFNKAHPKQEYRHTVAEEIDALRSVVAMARSLKPKNLNEQIAKIEQMDKDGVLEAYILLARPDRSIAQEHFDYVHAHRDRLRLYVTKYVIQQK